MLKKNGIFKGHNADRKKIYPISNPVRNGNKFRIRKSLRSCLDFQASLHFPHSDKSEADFLRRSQIAIGIAENQSAESAGRPGTLPEHYRKTMFIIGKIISKFVSI